MDIHRKSVDMDMDMDVKFHIHGNPGCDKKIIKTWITTQLHNSLTFHDMQNEIICFTLFNISVHSNPFEWFRWTKSMTSGNITLSQISENFYSMRRSSDYWNISAIWLLSIFFYNITSHWQAVACIQEKPSNHTSTTSLPLDKHLSLTIHTALNCHNIILMSTQTAAASHVFYT